MEKAGLDQNVDSQTGLMLKIIHSFIAGQKTKQNYNRTNSELFHGDPHSHQGDHDKRQMESVSLNT